MKHLSCLWWPALAGWIYFLAVGYASVPALGPLLEVRDGIWQHERFVLENQTLPGLKNEVTVTIDRSGVPHFFADSANDLFLVQGFVTASQRYFQLDINTRQTAGRLSELYGEQALKYDQFFTQLGLREAARRTWEDYAQDPFVKEMVEAYVRGVNLWVERMPELPPEYKVLGARPRKFEPVDVMSMGKALTWSLSGRSFDVHLTRYAQRIGVAKVLDLFPEFVPDKYEDFIIQESPGKPHAEETAEMFPFVSALKDIPKFPLPNPGRGSNNWAVGPRKSAVGKSILANDTHLTLTLPNTWYENQMTTPEFNVYGVALAAIPGVVAGFNKNIAWGPTNGTTDVVDFFEVEFENETSTRYLHNGAFEEASVRTEKVLVKNGAHQDVQVTETKLGALVHREGKLGLVMDWAGARSGQELKALRTQWGAKSAEECLNGFADWLAPIQNFACADSKNIGIRHAGFVPKRPVGEGRFIRDGRAGTGLRQGLEQVPQMLNPRANYLLSANQKVLPPGFSDYLGWDYEPPFRGMAIRHFLTQKEKLSPEDLMNIQNENLDIQAKMALPILLKYLGRDADPLVQKLRAWDYRIRAADSAGALYKAWWYGLKAVIFDDELGEGADQLYPKDARVLWMLDRLDKNPEDPDRQWLNGKSLSETVAAAFDKAVEKLKTEQGDDAATWNWKSWNHTRFSHAGRLPGFGTEELSMNGGTETIRGLGGLHGAVYKSVIVTGDWPKAWIQVPGGNDGDPFSPQFDRYVKDWTEGKMREAEFYRDRAEAESKAARILKFTPGGAP